MLRDVLSRTAFPRWSGILAHALMLPLPLPFLHAFLPLRHSLFRVAWVLLIEMCGYENLKNSKTIIHLQKGQVS